MPAEQNREILLAPQQYAYMQKEGNGTVSVHVGPGAIAATQQDVPIVYDGKQRRYTKRSLDQSVQEFPRAAEGEYVVLENPAEDGSFPSPNSNSNAKQLKIGLRQVIPGPWCQPLWPGQSATVLEGHRLRTNQFLIAVVYNEDQAKQNWDKTIIKAQTEKVPAPTGSAGESGETKPDSSPKPPMQNLDRGLSRPESFAVGTRIIIKGTEASFYIPPTGIEVARDENTGEYVREAVTLEQLEYCCLIDESGKKEYPTGPMVVFPRATQVFDMDSRKKRKWKAIELNTINGIHLKCVASFEGPDFTKPAKADGTRDNRRYTEGEELFVTGNELSIYYPREEFNIIEYGQGNKKHFSTAIPKGEGRYVINRESGEVKTVKGPKMLLCDPRNEIPVRRVLTQQECELWYPGSQAAADYNRSLEVAMQDSPSGRSGLISEGDYRKHQAKALRSSGLESAQAYLAASAGIGAEDALEIGQYAPEEAGSEGGGSGSIQRGTKYTPPRTITLNTKYDGVPKIEVWPSFAVLVVGSEGSRKVLEGPVVYLLEYDEKLGHQYLSTGKPKTTDQLLKTAYLQTQNNQVGDIIPFESKDHVKGTVKISLRVNFEGESEDEKLKWFSVENYVKYLTDHVRSILGGMAKRHTIAEIKGDYVNLVRDAILGQRRGAPASDDAPVSTRLNTTRDGLYFSDNGMRVVEVEVLQLSLADRNIEQLLDQAQHEVVRTDIELDQARKRLSATQEKERIAQKELDASQETNKKRLELEAETVESQLALSMAKFAASGQEYVKKLELQKAQEEIADLTNERQLARVKAGEEQKLAFEKEREAIKLQSLKANTESAKARFEAAREGLGEVLVALHRDDIAAKLAEATNMERLFSGDDIGSALTTLLAEFPILSVINERGRDAAKRLTTNRLRQPASTTADGQ